MNELQKMIKEIQYRTDETFDDIATRLDYARAYLNDQVNKGGNNTIRQKLIKQYPRILKQFVRSDDDKLSFNEDNAGYGGQPELLNVLIELMKRQNIILEKQTSNVESKVDNIETNLNDALGRVDSLKFDLQSQRDVVLRSLARLEKKPEDALLKEADNIIVGLLDAQTNK